MKLEGLWAAMALLCASPGWAQTARTVEREPNGVLAKATAATLGDTLLGEVVAEADTDFFAIDIPAGTDLFMERTSGGVSACLIDVDGTTILGCFNNFIETRYFGYRLLTAGRYFLRMKAAYPEAEVIVMGPYGIAINVGSFLLGPGDPPRTLASFGANNYTRYRLAAGYEGDVYALAIDVGAPVLRIHRSGAVSRLVTGLSPTGGFAVDAFGNLLISAADAGKNAIWSISPSGTKTLFAGNLGKHYTSGGFSITIGPDGDVWAGEVDTLWRLSPTGRLKSIFHEQFCDFSSLAVSPQGVVHFASRYGNCAGINAFTDRGRQPIMKDTVGDLAFDRDGRLYVTVWDRYPSEEPYPEWAHVLQLDSAYRVSDVIAHVPSLQGVQFLRNEQGEMTSRIVGAQYWLNRIVELNGASARAPGRDTRRFHRFDRLLLREGTLGVEYADTVRVPAPSGLAWSLEGGVLPPGLTFSVDGVIRGVPVDTGTFLLSVSAEQPTQVWVGEIVIRVPPISVSAEQIVDALLGGLPLDQPLANFLDRHGNQDGRLDVGDLRAYLRAQGRIMSPTSRARAADPN